ncbi:MAG: hypothetical protein U0704_01335 [Candidatus Eisenbacteria bacterium]
MIRRLFLLAISLCASFAAAAPAGATGAWTTYLRMFSCNDLVASRDTVWMASAEAGLVYQVRSTGAFGSFTREPGGLASNTLSALAFDRSGRLWAATPEVGVSRLSANRATWDLVNAFDGLPSDTVHVLRAEGDTLWIGTERGIALWDGTQIAGSVPDLGTPSPFRSNVVTGIVVVHDSLFVSTADGIYVARLSQQLATWANVDGGLLSTNVLALASDGREVFALANGTTYRWSMTAHTWGVAAGQGSVRKLRDGFGRMYSISATGIWKWVTNQWVLVSGSPVAIGSEDGGQEFSDDPDGVIFSFGAGVLKRQAAPDWTTVKPPGPVGNSVQNLLVDGSRVWVNTYGEGVGRWDGVQWRNWDPTACAATSDTTFANAAFAFTLLRDASGHIWTSHWEQGIERIDASVSPPQFDHVISTCGLPVGDTLCRHTDGWASAVDASGFVYIGGDTPDRGSLEPMGIDVYAPNGSPVINWKALNAGLGDNQVRAISVSKDSVIWVGFANNRGVSWATLASTGPGRLTLPAFTSIPELTTTDIFGVVAHGDSIWVLTTQNLRRISRVTRTLVSSQLEIPAGPAPRGAVRPLDVGPDGSVWVGTTDGVRHFKRGGGYEDFKTSNSPLANNELRAVCVDPVTGVVWFGTAAGINRFDPNYTPPAPPALSKLELLLYPNPLSLTRMGLELRLRGNTTAYTGEILDLGGRVVRTFAASANDRVIWDGRDSRGKLVQPGVYFVHARGGGREGIARAVVLR